MKIAIGNDHAGFEAKVGVVEQLKEAGFVVVDCGCYSNERCDYPDLAVEVAKKVNNNEVDFGVLICSSGEGISISANKVKGIRCGLAYNDEVACLIKKHNNANIISFGAKFMTVDDMVRRIDIFSKTTFEGGRHEQRINKIEKI